MTIDPSDTDYTDGVLEGIERDGDNYVLKHDGWSLGCPSVEGLPTQIVGALPEKPLKTTSFWAASSFIGQPVESGGTGRRVGHKIGLVAGRVWHGDRPSRRLSLWVGLRNKSSRGGFTSCCRSWGRRQSPILRLRRAR